MNKIFAALLALIIVLPSTAFAGFEGRANMAAIMTGAAFAAQQRAAVAAPYGRVNYGYGLYGTGGYGYGGSYGNYGGYNSGQGYGYGLGGFGYGSYPRTALCYCVSYPLMNRSFYPYPSEYYFGFGGYPQPLSPSTVNNLDFSRSTNIRANITNNSANLDKYNGVGDNSIGYTGFAGGYRYEPLDRTGSNSSGGYHFEDLAASQPNSDFGYRFEPINEAGYAGGGYRFEDLGYQPSYVGADTGGNLGGGYRFESLNDMPSSGFVGGGSSIEPLDSGVGNVGGGYRFE